MPSPGATNRRCSKGRANDSGHRRANRDRRWMRSADGFACRLAPAQSASVVTVNRAGAQGSAADAFAPRSYRASSAEDRSGAGQASPTCLVQMPRSRLEAPAGRDRWVGRRRCAHLSSSERRVTLVSRETKRAYRIAPARECPSRGLKCSARRGKSSSRPLRTRHRTTALPPPSTTATARGAQYSRGLVSSYDRSPSLARPRRNPMCQSTRACAIGAGGSTRSSRVVDPPHRARASRARPNGTSRCARVRTRGDTIAPRDGSGILRRLRLPISLLLALCRDLEAR
jgi:hypothetical protein